MFQKAFFLRVVKIGLCSIRVNSLPNKKFLDWAKFKAFADDKSKVAKVMISSFDKLESIVGKGENDGYQLFLRLPYFLSSIKHPTHAVLLFVFTVEYLVTEKWGFM